jgi:phasin family protein
MVETMTSKKTAAKPVKPAPKAVVPAAVPFAAEAEVSAPTVVPATMAAPIAMTPPAAPAPVAADIKDTTMNDTMEKTAETVNANAQSAAAQTSAFFNDANGRAKDAMAKGSKVMEEFVEFSKGNIEAVVTSGRIAAKGVEDIAKYTVEYGKGAIERANATTKRFAEVKSPTEFFQLQSEVAKTNLDAVVAEGSKFTEAYLKLLGEIAQPIQNRYAVAVEKVKTSVNA